MSKKFLKIIVFVSLFCVIGVVVVIFSANRFDYGKLRQSQTLSNLKQVGTAISLYSEDFDKRFPPDMSSVANARQFIRPFIKNESATKSANPGHPEFLGNGNLATTKLP